MYSVCFSEINIIWVGYILCNSVRFTLFGLNVFVVIQWDSHYLGKMYSVRFSSIHIIWPGCILCDSVGFILFL